MAFSKKAMIEHLTICAERLQKEHRFDPGNGWNQVKGKSEEVNRAYGQWRTYLQILDDIECGSIK